jgi:Tfp pilus assembly protein PilO
MKKSRLAVTVLLALLALSAVACLLSYGYGSIQDLSRQSRLNKFAAFKLQENAYRELSAEHADWKKLPEGLRNFRRDHIISMDDFAVFRRDLNSCLADNGFQVENIGFQFGGSQNHIRKVSISFALHGDYRELKKFIFDMENKRKMHFFTRIDLADSAGAVTGNFSMEAYLGE